MKYGSANYVIKTNSGGNGVEYGLLVNANITDSVITPGKLNI